MGGGTREGGSASVGVVEMELGSLATGVAGGLASAILWKRDEFGMAGDLFDGTVLLLAKPEVFTDPAPKPDGEAGATGVETPGLGRLCELCDDNEALRRTPPVLRRLSAPALALEDERTTEDF